MPKRFPERVNYRIKQIAIDIRAERGSLRYPNAAEIRRELRERDWSSEDIPSERHVRKVLSELDPVWISPIDSPWSLGVSDDHGIPSDATGVLMEVWRWSITREAPEPISIRTARWVAKLRWVEGAGGTDQGGVADLERLYHIASLYSGRERQVELIKNKTEKDKKGIRSGVLDAHVMLGANANLAVNLGILEDDNDIAYDEAFSMVAQNYLWNK